MYIITIISPQKYNVDVAFWGHHHSYQRSCPVFDGKCTEGATTHIVVGMGGQGLSQNIEYVRHLYIYTEKYTFYALAFLLLDVMSYNIVPTQLFVIAKHKIAAF